MLTRSWCCCAYTFVIVVLTCLWCCCAYTFVMLLCLHVRDSCAYTFVIVVLTRLWCCCAYTFVMLLCLHVRDTVVLTLLCLHILAYTFIFMTKRIHDCRLATYFIHGLLTFESWSSKCTWRSMMASYMCVCYERGVTDMLHPQPVGVTRAGLGLRLRFTVAERFSGNSAWS